MQRSQILPHRATLTLIGALRSPPPRPHKAPRIRQPKTDKGPIAAQLRALMKSEGISIAQAGGRLGIVADKARRILADYPLAK